jgi:hypothetical protein
MDPATLIASLLGASDPQGSARKILGYLVTLTGSTGGVVLGLRRESLEVFATVNCTVEETTAAGALWAENSAWLLKRKPIMVPDRVLEPLVSGELVTGGVLLLMPAQYEADDAAPYVKALAVIVGAALYGAPMPTPADLRPVIGKQERLIRALQQNEWNFSRTARALGCDRRTIYQQMERCNIKRPAKMVRMEEA